MRIRIIAVLTCIFYYADAQEFKTTAFMVDYSFQLPKGDLLDRFGPNSSIGLSCFFEKENGIFYELNGNYIFGRTVKDSLILEGISTDIGAIIATDGNYANVLLYERGFNTHIMLGYVFRQLNNNQSGFYLSAGPGFFQHKIRIETRNEDIPQLTDEYKKGYDKLTSGLSTKWIFDYRYFSKKGRFQCYAGIELIYAFTKNRRTYLFNKMQYTDQTLRRDILLGIRTGIIIPINRRNTEEFHYF